MTNNKFYSATATLSVYIANIDEYVKGNLIGKWISLPIKKSEWKDFLKTIGNPEEIAIHACDNDSKFTNFEIKDNANIEDLNKLARKLEEIKNKGLIKEFNALYETLKDFEDAIEYLETNRYLFYSGGTMEEVAKNFIEINCTIPKYLEDYIDYKAFANDMQLGGYYTKTSYGIIAIF